MDSNVRESVLKLIDERKKIEEEIEVWSLVLKKNGVGMNDPLVDADDFPLPNVDLYEVRNARQKIICLQNDHKAIMKNIEGGLEKYYDNADKRPSAEPMEVTSLGSTVEHVLPIVKITDVARDSPADIAGFRDGDYVVEIGSVNHSNFRTILDVSEVIKHSANQRVRVKLLRDNVYIQKILVPKQWNGPGLLGCRMNQVT